MFPSLRYTQVVFMTLVGLVSMEILPFSNQSDPPTEELVYQSSQEFQLMCEARKPLKWEYPHLWLAAEHGHDDGRIEIKNESISGRFRSTLKIIDSTASDTGYYTCYYENTNNTDDLEVVSRRYVYVEDEQQLVANTGYEGIVSHVAHQSLRTVIPCKPSSPNVTVVLYRLQDGQEVELNDAQWSYNPHEGFAIDSPTLVDDGYYECIATSPKNRNQTVLFVFDVKPATSAAPKPHIDLPAEKILLHDNFQLNCSASYDPGVNIDLKWKVPHPDGIDKGRIFTSRLRYNKLVINGYEQDIAYLVLNVTNATAADEGYYECTATDHTAKSESFSVAIKIHAEDVAYVNISNDGLKLNLEESANKSIKWVVNFDAFPEPKITWAKGKWNNILENKGNKHIIKTEPTKTTLEIKNLDLKDSGSYFLTITAKDERDSRSFTLRVKDKPNIKPSPESQSKVINLGEAFDEISFTVTSYPESRVEIVFRECIPPGNCSKSWISLNQTARSNKLYPNKANVIITKMDFQTKMYSIKGIAQVAGQYGCKACNNLGCSDSETDKTSIIKVYMNDLSRNIVNRSGLFKSQERDPVIGETFNLTCGVLLHERQKLVSWELVDTKGKSSQITMKNTKLPGAKLVSKSTKYSYAETLSWSEIPLSATGTYTCQTYDLITNNSARASIVLNVIPGRPPIIHNHSPSTKSIEQFNKLFLFCDADGLPPPTVEWLKDDSPITEGIEYSVNGSTFEILHANLSHSGKYTCRFRNINGTHEREMFVDVFVDNSIKTWEIAAITIVSIIIIGLVAFIGIKVYRDKEREKMFRVNQLAQFNLGNPDSINPDLPIDEQTELLPYDDRFEFPRNRLKLGKQLGAGAFGRVLKAEAFDIDSSEPVTIVAVKTVRSHDPNMMGLKALISELKIMVHLGSHLNVVNLLGACTQNMAKGDLYLIVEYCRYGNIQNYLIRNRASFINQLDSKGNIDSLIGAERLAETEKQQGYPVPHSPTRIFPEKDYDGGPTGATEISFLSMSPTGTRESELIEGIDSNGHPALTSVPSNSSRDQPYPPWRSNYGGDYPDLPRQPLCTRELVCWAFQIARGMDYLANRKVLHGDLAARNVLLADNGIVKIADFGLARNVYRNQNYKKTGDGPLPVKWMAIESFSDMCFSTQSDVWAFGIVLWELFSLGKTPYPGMEAGDQFFQKLKQGYRMDKPKYAPNDIYDIMKDCWQHEPIDRPSFAELWEKLGAKLESTVRHHYIGLNDVYEKSNKNKRTESQDYLKMMGPVDYVNVGSRPSPMPLRPVYENMPPNINVENDPQSEYLSMENNRLPLTDEDDYLCMSNSSSNQMPKLVDKTRQRQSVEDTLDSIEMCPMLDKSPPIEVNQQLPLINGFSNPNYQNPLVIKSSNLDDSPTTVKKSFPTISNQQFAINDESSHIDCEEPHYANPKSNVRVV